MDFAVVSPDGTCFICLDSTKTFQSLIKTEPDILEPESNAIITSTSTSKVYSIRSILSYLKLDMRKMFKNIQNDNDRSESESELKVELCERCASLNTKFRELHEKLEIIKMETNFTLKLIKEQFKNSTENSFKITGNNLISKPLKSISLNAEQLQILGSSRKEIIQKCSQKLSKTYPKVSVRKLTNQPHKWTSFESESEGKNFETFFEPDDDDSQPVIDIKVEMDLSTSIPPPTPTNSEPASSKKCSKCSQVFCSKQACVDHFNAKHKLQRQYKCSKCAKTFNWRGAYHNHISFSRTCGNSTTHTCETCGLECSSLNGLRMHVKRLHLKLKEFECASCKKRFFSKAELKDHAAAIHLKSKEYFCKICQLSFATKLGLGRHRKYVHLGIRKYECKDCPRKFRDNDGLQKHIDSVHLKLMHGCGECGKEFRNKGSLIVHRKNAHPGLDLQLSQV